MKWQRDLVEPHVIAFVDRARIDCERLFELQCPRYWGALRATATPTVRYCGECQKDVHLVTDEAELRMRAERRECVALILPDEIPADPYDLDPEDGGRPPMMMGQIALPSRWTRDPGGDAES